MINEADILLNNEVKVTAPRSQWHGHTGIVKKVMADGRTLEVRLNPPAHHDVVFIDVGLVSEIQEPSTQVQQPQSLGPIANSVVQDTI
jgi:ribosomal protein L21E